RHQLYVFMKISSIKSILQTNTIKYEISKFNIDGCYLTVDRRDIKSDLRLDGLENLFNVTLNYHQDADIILREQIMIKTEDTEDTIFPQVLDKKDKLVCWIMGNWNEKHERVKYYNELQKHINIYAFGRHFGKVVSDFYLSFENTDAHYDYITEKLFNRLTLGSVPVALGAPRYIYERFVLKDAFIHVKDFSSTQKLGEHLLSLYKNVEEYKKYCNGENTLKSNLLTIPKSMSHTNAPTLRSIA
uniref:Fucosyltransferase n=1 Tax=Sinocyclocheilus anshuiensis TaxID=1608454 RepID=A0A671T5I0_9TELE